MERYQIQNRSKFAVVIEGKDGLKERAGEALRTAGGWLASKSLFLFAEREQVDEALRLLGDLDAGEGVFVVPLKEGVAIEMFSGVNDRRGIQVRSSDERLKRQ